MKKNIKLSTILSVLMLLSSCASDSSATSYETYDQTFAARRNADKIRKSKLFSTMVKDAKTERLTEVQKKSFEECLSKYSVLIATANIDMDPNLYEQSASNALMQTFNFSWYKDIGYDRHKHKQVLEVIQNLVYEQRMLIRSYSMSTAKVDDKKLYSLDFYSKSELIGEYLTTASSLLK